MLGPEGNNPGFRWLRQVPVWLAVALFGGLLAAPGMGAAEKRFTVELDAGLGYDSNAFLAPERAFFDPFAGEIVVPRRQAGFFVPMSAEGEVVAEAGRARLVTTVDLEGKFFLENSLRHADSQAVRLQTMLAIPVRRTGKWQTDFTIGPTLAYDRRIYVDRDTGLEATTRLSDQDLSDRYQYGRHGLEAALRLQGSPVSLAWHARVGKYDYREVPVLDSLDYLYYGSGGEVEIDLRKTLRLEIDVDYYLRDFEDRRARDLAGNLQEGTDRRYSYLDTAFLLRWRPARGWWLYAGYSLPRREDEHAGYHDYTGNRYRGRLVYASRQRWKVSAEWKYLDRDYPRAFAFDRPGMGGKSYETREGEVRGEWRLERGWRVWSGYEIVRQNSSDPRYHYERHLLSIGAGLDF